MANEEKITELLRKYRSLVERLNELNDEMNAVGTDLEDMLPGHDEGQEFHSKMIKYQVVKDQLRMIREELRRLGYKRAL